MAYLNNLNKSTALDKGLRDKALNIAKIQKMTEIKKILLQWLIYFLIKKKSVGTVKNENISNKELAEELFKPIIKKIGKRKVYSSFKDNIWDADLANM